MRFFAVAILYALFLSGPVHAFDGKRTLGYGTQFNNDQLGDGRDRWQTGSQVVSVIRGQSWDGTLPGMPGEIVEYRFRAALAAPQSLTFPAPGDRRYAATLAIGAHTHFQGPLLEHSVGVDLVGIGPMTGIGAVQSLVHDLLGGPDPAAAQALQLQNALYPTATFEMGRSVRFGDMVTFRPFVETIAGAEVLARVGADLTIGSVWSGNLSLRDVVTGHRYEGLRGGTTGFGLSIGGDIAAVASSVYFPTNLGYTVMPTRSRLRAGLRYQGARFGSFYGLTYLSPEFQAQPRGQMVGTIRINARF